MMKDVYVARQPIFDRKKALFAYELLFRDGTANCVPDIDGDAATKTLLSNTFFTIGMDRISGGKPSFINFPQRLIEKKVPLLLPKENIVIEVLEDVNPEPMVVDACTQMAGDGYIIALDDFIYAPDLIPLIAVAKIIKFDFILTPLPKIKKIIEKLPETITLLAEKVETQTEFQLALDMGFELFQGYFFQKPEIMSGKEIPGSQLNLMMIVAQINKADFEIDDLEQLVSRDMGISYKLLRYINSIFFSRASKVSSIKQGLVYLGENEIKRFVSLIAISKLGLNKPDELIKTSCIRGKFCELLAGATTDKINASELFTLGMFSMIDAIIDQPMNRIMNQLPLSDDIKDALVNDSGEYLPYIRLAKSYEKGDWDGVKAFSHQLEMNQQLLPELYMKACRWSDGVSKIYQS